MSIRLQIFDGATPLLDKIAKISVGMALESLSVAGAHVQKQARISLRSKSHNWHQSIIDGKKQIRYDGSQMRELGVRMSQKDGTTASPRSMANFINSYLMAERLTVVIGGMHKGFNPVKYQDGFPVGSLPKVAGVSKGSHAILHKLNFGELNEEYTSRVRPKSMKRFENANYKGYRFMQEGYGRAKPLVEDAMTRRAERLFHEAVNKVEIRRRVVS